MKTRVKYMDIAKGIGIICVLLGLKMSTLNAKVFLIFSLSAICTINRAVLLCNFHMIQVFVLE